MEATGEQGARVLVPKGPRAQAARDRELDWTRQPHDPPLPDWLVLRDYQLDAVERAVKEYERGSQVVFLDAPTGTGKTAIAELVRRRLEVRRGLYVCTTKSLQEQVARDFTYARVLKGRANYTPTSITRGERDGYVGRGRWLGGGVTCGDCDAGPAGVPQEDQSCSYCAAVEDCPYQIARKEAGGAAMGVLNTSFLLTHLNVGGGRAISPFRDRELVVADECDLLEDELLGYVELRLGARVVADLGLEVPKKGSHMTTIRAWLENEVEPGLKKLLEGLRGGDLETKRTAKRLGQLRADVARVIEREDGWVRDGDEEGDRSGNALVLKPVSVEDVGERFLWRHGQRWLCMSGTIVSAETMAEGLGLEAAGIEWGVVDLPMRFAKEHRRVVFVPVATMTKKAQEAEGSRVLDDVKRAVEVVLAKHPGTNVLIHTHTYKLAAEISAHLGRSVAVPVVNPEGGPQYLTSTRDVITYLSARDRESAMARFRAAAGEGGAVMVAASMDRGVDLPGDLCRVQVIVKVPMASLGSRQVSERLRTPGGSDWYLANTVRTLMQMTGRAVRGQDDWAVCYILDSHFSKVLGDGKKRGMWPQWWLDALELGRVKEYMG